jgi:hypothetical protein
VATDEAQTAATSIATQVKDGVERRKRLKQQIDWKGTDPEERKAMLDQLKEVDADIEAKLASEAGR